MRTFCSLLRGFGVAAGLVHVVAHSAGEGEAADLPCSARHLAHRVAFFVREMFCLSHATGGTVRRSVEMSRPQCQWDVANNEVGRCSWEGPIMSMDGKHDGKNTMGGAFSTLHVHPSCDGG